MDAREAEWQRKMNEALTEGCAAAAELDGDLRPSEAAAVKARLSAAWATAFEAERELRKIRGQPIASGGFLRLVDFHVIAERGGAHTDHRFRAVPA